MNQIKTMQRNRERLHHLISENSLKHKEVYEQSCILDQLIVQYMKKQIPSQKI